MLSFVCVRACACACAYVRACLLYPGSDLFTCDNLYSRGIWTGGITGMCLFRNNRANLVPTNGTHEDLMCCQ